MPFLEDIINNHKNYGKWKIQLITRINFISSLDTGEFCRMYSKSNNVKILISTETDDFINEIFKSFLKKYQEGLEIKMKGSEFVFDSLIYCITNFIK